MKVRELGRIIILSIAAIAGVVLFISIARGDAGSSPLYPFRNSGFFAWKNECKTLPNLYYDIDREVNFQIYNIRVDHVNKRFGVQCQFVPATDTLWRLLRKAK